MLVVRIAAIAFVVLFAASASYYPGGSAFDRNSLGYDLADNYVCDTFRARAYDGRTNAVGAALGQVGMVALVIASAGSLFAAASLYRKQLPRLAKASRGVAALSFIGMLAVPLTPAHEYGHLHFISVGVAAVPALVAAFLVAAGVLQVSRGDSLQARTLRVLTITALVVSTLHFGQYLNQAILHAGESPWIPRSQKLVLGIDLAFIVALTFARPPSPTADRAAPF